MKLVLLDEAQRRFEAEDAWWREHRDAKELFVQEFANALEQVSTMPERGQRYRRARSKLIQRVLMKKTRCHVYYFHDREQNLVEIHSVWGARKSAARTCNRLLVTMSEISCAGFDSRRLVGAKRSARACRPPT